MDTRLLFNVYKKSYRRWNHIVCLVGYIIPANIRLGEDVLKASYSVTIFCLPRHFQDIIARRLVYTSWRLLENILNSSCENVFKTSSRRFKKTYCKTKKCYAEDFFKTSWRRLGKQVMFPGMVRNSCHIICLHLLTTFLEFDPRLHCFCKLSLSWELDSSLWSSDHAGYKEERVFSRKMYFSFQKSLPFHTFL